MGDGADDERDDEGGPSPLLLLGAAVVLIGIVAGAVARWRSV